MSAAKHRAAQHRTPHHHTPHHRTAQHRATRRVRHALALFVAFVGLPLTVLLAVPVALLVPWSEGATPAARTGTHAMPRQPTAELELAQREQPRQLVTVTASSRRATTAVVQRWERHAARWVRVGAPARAHLGAQGLTGHPTEQVAATPIGTFTLTQAFGGAANTGHRITKMSYIKAKYGYGWGSDPHNRKTYNRLYNCHCDQGELYRLRTSYMRLGLVIDYNRNPVVPGRGSGFFVHVTDGLPTAGCVGMSLPDLTRLLAWLDPAASPHITIRVA